MGVSLLRSVPHALRRVGVCRGVGLALLLWTLHLGCRDAGCGEEAVLAGQVVDGEAVAVVGAAVYVSREDVPVGEAVTDAEGHFRIGLAGPGPVDVRAGKAEEQRDDEGSVSWRTLTAEVLAVSPDGGALRLVLAADPREGTVRVRLSSRDGYVTSATVRAVPLCWPPDAAWWWRGGHTNDIGRVDLGDLPRVPVALHVERAAPWCPARGPVVLPDPRGIDLYRITIERERILEGRVLDEDGEPVVGAGVMVASDEDTASRAWGDLTGRDGRFTVGVPESWIAATLLVGCDVPEERSAHRLAVPIDTTGEAAPAVCLKRGTEPVAAPEEADEPRRVMGTVLRAHYVREDQDLLVLGTRLGGLGRVRDVTTYLQEGVEASTVRDLERKADEAAALPVCLDVGVETVRIAPSWWGYLADVHGTLNRGLWRHFYARFPRSDGLVSLSPVAFSENGEQAVVHVVSVRARLNADGFWYLLEKRDGAWHVVRRAMTWIS